MIHVHVGQERNIRGVVCEEVSMSKLKLCKCGDKPKLERILSHDYHKNEYDYLYRYGCKECNLSTVSCESINHARIKWNGGELNG